MNRFCILLILWFLLGGLFENIPLISYVDELLAVFSYIYIIINYHLLTKSERRIFVLCFYLGIIGVIGNYYYKYQTNMFPILLDFLQCIKVFITFIAGNHIIGNLRGAQKFKIVKNVSKLLYLYIIIAFCCAIISLFADIGMSADTRFGLRCFKFYYGNSGGYANSLYLVLMFLTIYRYYKPNNRFLFIIIVMSLISWILTFRSRGLLFIVIYSLLYYIIIYKRKILEIKISSIIILVAFAFYMTADQIENYFNNENMPRAILLHYGLETMHDCFPLGAGFGTYGTDVAVKYYSDLYVKYGMDRMYGFVPDNPLFAHDCYWPAIFGQFGFIGTILVVLILFYWVKQVMSNNEGNRYYYMCSLFIVITQIFSSVPTSVFFSPNTTILFFFLPFMKKNNKIINYI